MIFTNKMTGRYFSTLKQFDQELMMIYDNRFSKFKFHAHWELDNFIRQHPELKQDPLLKGFDCAFRTLLVDNKTFENKRSTFEDIENLIASAGGCPFEESSSSNSEWKVDSSQSLVENVTTLKKCLVLSFQQPHLLNNLNNLINQFFSIHPI